MTRRKVVPDLLAVLDPWLHEIQGAYDRQPSGGEQPMPLTPDGKVNVVGIVRALGVPPADQKWFHTRDELRDLVNAFAEEQGVKPIVRRSTLDQADASVKRKIGQMVGRQKQTNENRTEAPRRIEHLTAENERLRVERDRPLEPSRLYTAITRSQSQAVIIGPRSALETGMKRRPAFRDRITGFDLREGRH